jgi:prepilin signal peptidase PulO-like enzyme (type II secretory pathway)
VVFSHVTDLATGAWVVAGLMLGSLLHWAADYLPRLAADQATRPESNPRFRPALWHLLASIVSRKRLSGLAASVWFDLAVEVFTALLFAYLWGRFGFSWRLLWLAWLCAFFILVGIVDLRYRLIPNVLIFPTAALILLLSFVYPGLDALTALLGGAVGLILFALAAWVRPGGLGGGDVKLAALIGLLFGFPHVLWALMVGILAGGVTAILLLLTRRWNPKTPMPYAPFLCLGALVALLYNPWLTTPIHFYLGLLTFT